MNTDMTERWDQIRARIQQACARSNRSPDDVQVVAVSKTHGPDRVQAAAALGLTIFGENRVQEAREKIPVCSGHLQWHLVGHLQSNKVKDAVRLFSMIHSVDSVKLLQAIDAAGELTGRIMPVCLEVNVSGEASKYGLTPEQVPDVLSAANELRRVEVTGVMTIPPVSEDPQDARPYFLRLRELRDQWRKQSGYELKDLSMGMSHDFEVAIEAGATWIRLGTILFGQREKNA